jgi:Fe-S cluster biogenesis protein NfuA
MKNLGIISLALLFSCTACKTKQPTVKEETGLDDMYSAVVDDNSFITVDPAYVFKGVGDPFTVQDMQVKGDTLYVQVQYSGGCKSHEFKMITTGQFYKSLPPQLPLYLTHVGNGDNCRSLRSEKLKFNLKPLLHPSGIKAKLLVNDNRDAILEYPAN